MYLGLDFGTSGARAWVIDAEAVTVHSDQHAYPEPDKQTPLEFYVDPGNYEVVVTLPGYKPLRRMISVQKDGKLTIDEALEK